jgi:GWxTD domain-containing protein
VFFRSQESRASDISIIESAAALNLAKLNEMEEDQLETEFEVANYISTKTQRNQFKSLNLAGKRQFLINFWLEKSKQVQNADFRDDYLERVAYANLNWKERFKAGWKSDRGRVYIKYGPPDETEVFHETSDTREYEIWLYNQLQGGVLFIFADLQDRDIFQLIHSSMDGEIRNFHWMEFISR